MNNLPRIAIGCFQEQADHRLASWGLMALLSRLGLDVQPYHPQSAFSPSSAASTATGRDPRHLDPWQMGQRTCRELLAAHAHDCDIAVMEGAFGRRVASTNLDQLAQWLSIPRIAVVDCTRIHPCDGTLRELRTFDGVILDRVDDAQTAARLAVDIESIGRTKVLGRLPTLASLRSQLHDEDAAPSLSWCERLARVMSAHLDFDRLLDLAHASPALPQPHAIAPQIGASRVALAFDEAFHCYFPDMLDRMEEAGCRIRTFSPLRMEALPPDSDIVIFGCGKLQPFAKQLSENRCLHHALAAHKHMGKRIYAEGAGAAFLCREVTLANGASVPMSGVLPAYAQQSDVPGIQPVEARWRSPLWLGGDELSIRGYRNLNWNFSGDPYDSEFNCCPSADTLMEANVIGTRVHVNFAAHPTLLADFVQPLCPASISG